MFPSKKKHQQISDLFKASVFKEQYTTGKEKFEKLVSLENNLIGYNQIE